MKWCKPYEAEEAFGDQRWITSLYPSDEREWKKISDAELQLEAKEDEFGKFIRVRRSVKKSFPNDDEVTRFSPPKITGAVNVEYVDEKTNDPVRSYKKSDGVVLKRVGDQKLIGNESLVILNICVYPTKQGNGHRWESMNVLDLVEYSPDEETTKEETRVSKEEASEKTSKKKVIKTETSVKEDMNDEIPW